MSLEISRPCIEWLASNAYSPKYGARPLKRAIEEYILDPLSISLIEGKVKEGESVKIQLIDAKTKEQTANISNGVITIIDNNNQ